MAVLALAAVLAGCAGVGPQGEPAPPSPAEVRAQIASLMPANVPDRAGWAVDIHAAFIAMKIAPTLPNLCVVLAVTEQESGYRADPAVPNLPKIARSEIERRAQRLHVPQFALSAALGLVSPDGRTYAERLDVVRTEKELSDIFEDFVDMAPLGRRLFADFNAGRYASRNAAFQRAVSVASGISLALDGDLVRHGDAAPGNTERAVRSLGPRLGMSDAAIRQALEQGEGPVFAQSVLYRRVFELADQRERRPLPRAVVPHIMLTGPKITRKLTTEWFANRVEDRQRRCLARAAA